MTLTHRADERRFEMDLGPDGVAYVAYETVGDGVLDLQHTIVPESAQGRGVGTTLVQEVFDHARREGVKVLPSCPFVSAWLAEHPEGEDVVA